ncbi:hypothetical protein YPPY47_2179, partial [Yersinia pestis PY-47]|jgi:hypothetical protein
MKI